MLWQGGRLAKGSYIHKAHCSCLSTNRQSVVLSSWHSGYGGTGSSGAPQKRPLSIAEIAARKEAQAASKAPTLSAKQQKKQPHKSREQPVEVVPHPLEPAKGDGMAVGQASPPPSSAMPPQHNMAVTPTELDGDEDVPLGVILQRRRQKLKPAGCTADASLPASEPPQLMHGHDRTQTVSQDASAQAGAEAGAWQGPVAETSIPHMPYQESSSPATVPHEEALLAPSLKSMATSSLGSWDTEATAAFDSGMDSDYSSDDDVFISNDTQLLELGTVVRSAADAQAWLGAGGRSGAGSAHATSQDSHTELGKQEPGFSPTGTSHTSCSAADGAHARPGRSPFDLAKAYALKVLGQSPQSTQELRLRLTGRGYEADVVEQVVERMTEARLLDDAAYATLYVRSKWINNFSSPTKIAYELQKKGLCLEHAEAGLIEVFDSTKSVYVPSEEDEDTDVSARLVYAASRALRGREAVGVKEVQAARRRVASWLAYRGHGPSTAAQVLKRIGL